MKKKKEPWYIGQRAEKLALVYLSRLDDLEIETPSNSGSDHGLDFLISLRRDGDWTGKYFGVQVKGRQSIQASPMDDQGGIDFRLDLTMTDIFVPADVPFPLCLFVFNMEDDEGFYKWLKAPDFDSTGGPRLMVDKINLFHKLTTEALENIVATVNQWYEKRFQYTQNTQREKN